MSMDEVGNNIKHFLHKFSNEYSWTGPLAVSFSGSLDEALNHSLLNPTLPRPLVLYLHHNSSIAVHIFCQCVLFAESITDYLSEEFLIWMWDRTQDVDYSTLMSMLRRYTTTEVANTIASYPIDAYPLLVCLSVHQNQIDIVSVIQGTMSRTETMAALLDSRKKFDRRAELPHSKIAQKPVVVLDENHSTPAKLLEPLTEHSSDIDKIVKDFNNDYMEIICINRIENATWLPPYLSQKKIIDARLDRNQNEYLLFHGCSRSAAEKIIRRGFDHKLIGMHGTSYGRGFYFSSDHRLSHIYAMRDLSDSGEITMLVCRVLVGRSCLGTWAMRKCPDGYDSTTDGSNIYVVYSNEQILPEYLITYKEGYGALQDVSIVYGRKQASSSGWCTIS